MVRSWWLKGVSINGVPVEVAMPADVKLWSPESPSLYDLEISLFEGNKLVDKVKSYAAMRKFSTKRDKNGIVRLQLNNKDLVPVRSFRPGLVARRAVYGSF